MAQAIDPAAPTVVRSRWVRHAGGLALLAGAGLGLAAIAQWRDHHVLMINVSQSLPDWAFLVREGSFPRRGDYVVFAPGHALLVRRHFGERPQPFVKIAYGVPGDRVTREGATVAVNGAPVARLKPVTRQGEPLHPGPLGQIPEGCVFAASPHKDGFDSRYAAIGWICRPRILGTGRAIL